jgi:hypothetical protein
MPAPSSNHHPPTCLFDVLMDDDALRSALLPTSAADHIELRKTCRRIRELVDGDVFAQERCEGGFAEISVALVDPFEMYGGASRDDLEFQKYYNDLGAIGEYGDTRALAKNLVDGREAGDIDMQLLLMNSGYNMHEIGGAISAELQGMTSVFFTPRGRPRTRVKSVRQEAYESFVVLAEGNALDEGFLYISELKLKPPYRSTSTACARALRSLLEEPRLSDQWTLAMYIPFGIHHMTEEEMDKKYDEDETMDPHAFFHRKKLSQEYVDILEAKTLVDMRYFLRAGFQQVPETIIRRCDSYYVFCFPAFLKPEMIPAEQALSMEIITAPKAHPELSRGLKSCWTLS